MKKELWTSIITSIVGILNLIAYLIVTCCGLFKSNWLSYVILFGFFVCVWLPVLLSWWFKLKFNLVSLICYQVFLVASLVVGSVWRVYSYFDAYDIIIHSLSGVLIALIAYSLFVSSKKHEISLVWLFVLVFAIAMACGGIWEIWEFATDGIFGNNAQVFAGFVGREALMDTMTDIICDFVGGIVGAIIVVLIERKRRLKSSTQQEVESSKETKK